MEEKNKKGKKEGRNDVDEKEVNRKMEYKGQTRHGGIEWH